MVEARSVDVKNTRAHTRNASKPFNKSKGLGGNIGCRDNYSTSYMVLKGFPNVVTWGQQYNIEEKPTVILYTNINRHVGTPKQNKKQYQTINRALGIQYFWTKSCYFDKGSLQKVIDVKNLKFTTCPLRLNLVTYSKVKRINRGLITRNTI